MTPIKLDGIMPWLIVLLWVITAAGIGAYGASVARNITYVTLADGRKRERRLPFLFRLLIPLTPNVAPLFRRALFAAKRQAITRRIVSAGYEDLVSAEEFLGLRLLMPLLLGPFWILMVRLAAVAGRSALLLKLQPGLFAIGVLWLALYPGLWLTGAVQARHREIQRALPFVLGLLTLSVEAGMDFMSSLQRNVERRVIDALDLFGIGYSWGGFESLALPFDVKPVRSKMPWPKPGWGVEDVHAIRLSIGLEDAGDLIADLERAFAAMDRN